MEGYVCEEDYTFYGKNALYIKSKNFYTSEYSIGS